MGLVKFYYGDKLPASIESDALYFLKDGLYKGSQKIADITDTISIQSSINEVIKDVENLDSTVQTNYNESIISLSVKGQTVTYMKGDGSIHSFQTQDTDTTYSLGTDEITGLTKLYATTGSAEDGTMTQKAIKTELDKKVGVSINENMLVFTV